MQFALKNTYIVISSPILFFPHGEGIDQLTDLGQVSEQGLLFSVINQEWMGRALLRKLQSDSGGEFQLSSAWKHLLRSKYLAMGIRKRPLFVFVFVSQTSVVARKGKTFLACFPVEGTRALKRGNGIF